MLDETKKYDVSTSEPDALSKMSAQEIIDALQLLTPAYRTVFNLYVIEGYPHKEIAKILNITESTSRSNLVKARTKLKNILLNRSHLKRKRGISENDQIKHTRQTIFIITYIFLEILLK